jgi:hypothetical protein
MSRAAFCATAGTANAVKRAAEKTVTADSRFFPEDLKGITEESSLTE